MGTSAKPRHRYRPRPIAANPIQLAMRRAAKVPADELAEVMGHITSAFTALREGVASEIQWCVLASSVELGLAVERGGVIKGLQGHLKSAEAALQAIYQRAMASGSWQPTALYYQEIEHVDTFVWLHKTQLESLSEGEWRNAHALAVGVVRSAGGQVVDVGEVQAQLPLLGERS